LSIVHCSSFCLAGVRQFNARSRFKILFPAHFLVFNPRICNSVNVVCLLLPLYVLSSSEEKARKVVYRR
jgi:hypothetical protein